MDIEREIQIASTRDVWEIYFTESFLEDLNDIKNGDATIDEVIKFYEENLKIFSQR